MRRIRQLPFGAQLHTLGMQPLQEREAVNGSLCICPAGSPLTLGCDAGHTLPLGLEPLVRLLSRGLQAASKVDGQAPPSLPHCHQQQCRHKRGPASSTLLMQSCLGLRQTRCCLRASGAADVGAAPPRALAASRLRLLLLLLLRGVTNVQQLAGLAEAHNRLNKCLQHGRWAGSAEAAGKAPHAAGQPHCTLPRRFTRACHSTGRVRAQEAGRHDLPHLAVALHKQLGAALAGGQGCGCARAPPHHLPQRKVGAELGGGHACRRSHGLWTGGDTCVDGGSLRLPQLMQTELEVPLVGVPGLPCPPSSPCGRPAAP